MTQATSRDKEITYRCPECGGSGRKAEGQAPGYPRPTSDEPVEPECPLCHGSGRVKVRELANYYLGEFD